MTPGDARACLDRGEPDVLYRPAHGDPEHGVITSVSDRFVFVRYGTQATSAATDPADLEALSPEQARRWLWRHPLRTGGGECGHVFGSPENLRAEWLANAPPDLEGHDAPPADEITFCPLCAHSF